ncbi:MAG TPA: hypothetical protein VE734_12705 [Terriglobales bacterium]|nr:hypothetical protein [Terriglobales bacterium]
MRRAVLFALLAASAVTAPLEAQRARTIFQGHATGLPVRSGFIGQRGVSNGFFLQHKFPDGFFARRAFFPNRFRFRQEAFGGFLFPYFLPDYEPFWYEHPYAEPAASGPAPPVVILHSEGHARAPETPPLKPLLIEVPGVAISTAAKKLPPTIFVLTNGERLETRRFLLTASAVSLRVDRRERTIPLDMVDLDATIAANHERGIDLRIPADRNEIFLAF